MKNIKLRSVIVLISLLVFTIQGCKKVDEPTPVSYKAFTTPVSSTNPATRADGTVLFTGSTVDLVWTSQTGGNADSWTVYVTSDAGDSKVYEKVAKQLLTVPVVDGVTYTWYIVAVDKNGLVTTGAENTFTAVNGSNPAMTLGLNVTTDVKTAIPMDLTPDQVVDLRLLIVAKVADTITAVEDAGAANEIYSGFGDLPDGEYLVGVDIYSTKNFGSFNKPINLSLTLNFDQLGIISEALSYPNVMTNANACDVYRTYLATVVKVGSQYTITSTVSNWVDPVADPAALVGTWSGIDADPGYPSEVVSSLTTAGKLVFEGIGRGWMQDAWGEVIVTQTPISMNFNYCAGTLTIPSQPIMTTTYLGDAQPAYTIQGNGTFDLSGDYPAMLIHYNFYQGTTGIAQYFSIPYFTLEISLAPGKRGPNSSGTKVSGFPINPRR